MNNRESLTFKLLMNRYHAKDHALWLSFLPESHRASVQAQKTSSQDLSPVINQNRQLLSTVHFSWIKPLLRKLPKGVIPLVISCLNAEQKAGFKSTSLPTYTLSENVKDFLMTEYLRFPEIDTLIPVEFLPPSPFGLLLEKNKQELHLIIDYLGIYDLAAEVRTIVQKERLKNIYACLSSKQFYFLKNCLSQKEKLKTPPLGIDLLKPDAETMRQLIHRRGLFRLANALSLEHPDFIWYLAHILDSNRGQILMNQTKQQRSLSITQFLQQQVMNVIQFLKSE